MKNIRNGWIYILPFVFVFALSSCGKVKMAANSESEILTFMLEEYPDAKVEIIQTSIFIYLPEEVVDLNLTPIYTVSEGATSSPESREKQDFGFPVGFGVLSEDQLYYTVYHAYVIYPANRFDFNSISLPTQSERYGEDFELSYASFHSAATASGTLKWEGFALSNRSGADQKNPPADVIPWQFYPNADSGLGNMLLVRAGYGPENAAEMIFSRPINPDSFTVVPSALTIFCMENGYTNDAGQPVAAMNTDDGDYMLLVLEAYDADDELVGTKTQYIANYTYAERPYIREGWQTLKLNATRFKDVRKMKIYVEGARPDFYPVFAIDKFTFQVQPQLTPSDDDEG